MGSLSTTPVLVMNQITSVARCDFDILDAAGAVVGAATTEGGALERFFTGPRQFTVLDTDGTAFVHIDDVPNLGRDRYELIDPTGRPIGRITKEVTFFKKRLTVEVVGRTYELNERDFGDREFDIAGPSGRLVTVRRTWPGLAAGLLGRSRYVVAFEADEDTPVRQAALGSVIAIELIRLKARRNASTGATMGSTM